jgi:predicted metal-dependent hydrolase
VSWFKRRRSPTRVEETLPLPIAGNGAVYLLKRSSARRTLALRVTDQGEIAVNAPLRLPQHEVDRFLQRHADWLKDRLETARTRVFTWRDGAELPWLGGHLSLRLLAPGGRPTVRQEADLLLCAAEETAIGAVVTHWYRREARPLLAQRLAHHATRLGRPTPPLRLSDARTRWGSLSPKGVVSLNWRLAKASPEEIDYVICHELAHFRQRNHSPAFWREVAALFPDFVRVRDLLRRNGRLYFEF